MSDLKRLQIDRSKGAGRTGRRPAGPWFGRVLLLVVLVALGFVFQRQILGFVDRFRLPEVRLAAVVEENALAASAVSGTSANGYVVAARRAALSADTPGRIAEMLVTEGSVVRAGDVVARLDSQEQAAAVRMAQAELDAIDASLGRALKDVAAREADVASAETAVGEAEARLLEARASVKEALAQVELARANQERAAKLVEDGHESQQRLDETRAELASAAARAEAAEAGASTARAAIETARAGVAVAQAALAQARAAVDETEAQRGVRAAARDQAQATLEKTEVRAPFDGIVVLKDAEVGEVVSPNSQGGSNARGSVVTMVDFASLEVQVDVPETSLSRVVPDGPAAIFLDAFPSRRYSGRVDRIWPTADRQKATVEVRVVFDAPDELLRPEMGVRVVFDPGPRAEDAREPGESGERGGAGPVLLVPSEALTRLAGERGVFVLEQDAVRFRPLKLGPGRSGRQVVLAGLEAGERIVLAPSNELADGTRVRIVP